MAEQGYGQFPNQGRFTRRSDDPTARRFRLPKGTGAEGTSNDSLAATLADDYFWNVPAGGSTINAVGAAALGTITVATTATVAHSATGTAPLGTITSSTTARVDHQAAGAAPLGALAAATTASVAHQATGTAPLGALTASTTGTVTPGPATITAAGDAPLGALTATATAAVTITATGSAPLGAIAATVTVTDTPTTETGGAYRPKFRYERIDAEPFTLTDDDLAALALVLLEV